MTSKTKLPTYKFYINGEWRESSSGQTIDIQSPYLPETLGKVQSITQDEVDEIISFSSSSSKRLGRGLTTGSCEILI